MNYPKIHFLRDELILLLYEEHIVVVKLLLIELVQLFRKELGGKRDLKKPTKNARKNANLFEYLLLQQKNCNVRSNELKTAAEAALHFPDEKIIL